MAQLNYTPDYNDTYQGFECLPAGEYKVIITDSEIKESANGNSEFLKLTYEVIADQQYDGRKIFDNIILSHKTSAEAVRISQQKLNTICSLTGVKHLKDSVNLHGKTMAVMLSVKDNNGEKQNTIKKYLPFKESGQNEESAEETGPKKPAAFIRK